MSFQQSGPNASAYIGVVNDVGGSQYSVNGNEVFQIFDLYITVDTHNKIIAGNNRLPYIEREDPHEALIRRKKHFGVIYIYIDMYYVNRTEGYPQPVPYTW